MVRKQNLLAVSAPWVLAAFGVVGFTAVTIDGGAAATQGAILAAGGVASLFFGRRKLVGADQEIVSRLSSAVGDDVADGDEAVDRAVDRLESLADVALTGSYTGAAFQHSSVAMMMIDRDFKVTQVNEATQAMFKEHARTFKDAFPNFDPERIIGTCIDIFHQNPAHQRGLLADPTRLPHRAGIKVGAVRFDLTVSAVVDATGQYVGNVMEWADVTVAHRNEAILRAITEHQATIEFTPEGNITTANRNFLNAMGYTLDEIVGRHHRMFMPEEDRVSPEYANFWKELAGGSFKQGTFRRIDSNGQDVWIDATYNSVEDSSGKVFKIVKIANDVTERQHELDSARKSRKEREHEQKQVVEALNHGLQGIASGNLDITLDEPFSEAYEQLRHDFNSAIGQIRTSITQVVESAGSVRSGASEISQAADELARRTETQANTLEETANSLKELTKSIAESAHDAQEINEEVTGARNNAEESGRVVNEAVGAMSEIESSSEQISQIISVIDDIAFQTNLLALNAGVEAARAGEAGKGFAVVASEVRALAQRSSDAAKEIKGLIGTSSQHVKRGVDLVGRTGEALGQMVESVTKVSELIGSMAESAQEQSAGLGEISTQVDQLDSVTQQNAAMVEESTAASHTLTQDADGLRQATSFFQLGDNGPAPAAASSKAPSQSSRPPVHQQQERAAQFAGNAALDTQAEDWEDF